MAKPVVGLDIGSHSVHLAEVSSARGGELHLKNFGVAMLPAGAVKDGEIRDPDAVAGTITTLIERTGIKAKDVVLGVANQRVFVRQVDLPWMDESELRSSLEFQVQEFIPIPVEEAELDFYVLDEPIVADEKKIRILLVGAQKDMVATHVEAVQKAGLRPTVIDLNALALLRILRNYQPVIGESTEVLIDIGDGVTNMVIHEAGVPKFARTLILGGGDLTRAVAEHLDVDLEQARAIKHETGLVSDPDNDAAGVIARRAYHFLDEIRGSLDYYRAQGGTQVTQVLLCGGGALLEGLPERLEAELRVPVEIGSPFTRVRADVAAYTSDQLTAVQPLIATSVGLAAGGLL